RRLSGDARDGTDPGAAGSRRVAHGNAGAADKARAGAGGQDETGSREPQIRNRGRKKRTYEHEGNGRVGRRSVLSCPDCGGVMWEIDEEGLVRYRCHVGHAYTADVMNVALDESLRRALASGLRALEE